MEGHDPGGDGQRVRLPAAGLELTGDVSGDPEGTAVVLLHGGGQTRHAWGTAAGALAATGHRVLSLDLRGHGESDWSPDGDYHLDRFVDDVRAVAAGLPHRPVLVGASLGGLASLIAIGESADPVARALVLVDVAPRLEMEGTERIHRFMRSGTSGFPSLQAVADAISEYQPHRPRPRNLSGLRKNLRLGEDGLWYWHWDPRFLSGAHGADERPGITDRDRLASAARHVTVPTLLVRGRLSDVVSDEGVQELRELIPHAEVVDVADAAHMVAGDANSAFDRAVIDFIEREGGAPREGAT